MPKDTLWIERVWSQSGAETGWIESQWTQVGPFRMHARISVSPARHRLFATAGVTRQPLVKRMG